jgi:hypothetical protein
MRLKWLGMVTGVSLLALACCLGPHSVQGPVRGHIELSDGPRSTTSSFALPVTPT